ncbi:MAG TPA: hypothetical protein VGO26_11980 [Amnibacterium sp.]|nr:hypothetical protein [Amnibacterium sp.]
MDTARAGETHEDGQPISRRAARERERRAAEALAEGRAHPSGVVDFEGHDFGGEFHADQEIPVQNTADIWAALSRRADTPPAQPVDGPHTGDLARFRSGVPEAPTRRSAPAPASPMTGELLERVRDAVLREHEAEPLPTVRTPVQQPPISRRELRRRQAEQTTEDGMPAAWFSDGDPGVPAAFARYDDAPTVAMPALDRAELEAQTPMTAPVNLPQFFAAPKGDDSLLFSSPVPLVDPDPQPEVAEAEPEFIEPQPAWRGRAWSQVPDDYAEPVAYAEPGGYAEPPAGFAEPPAAFAEPPAAFGPEQVGPPSEVTDLAGFEALIRRARSGQPQAAPEPMFKQAEQQRPALPWADDEDDAQDYTGLLGRPVQGSNGSANALILSDDPQPDLTQAVNRTGDIFITGSLNLPRSLAQTGATTEHYDSLDIDRLFEASQDEPAAGVAPVRASRAVSGTGSTRAIIGGRRARGNVLPTVLAIIAGAMAVGVVTLLVGSWVLKLF